MPVDEPLPVDAPANPPAVTDGLRFDEEPPQHVPGSFLSSLPQFFVFPLILVATLTAIFLGLRVLAGSEPDDASELLREVRAAGPHARWQHLHALADGLGKGSLTLDDVPAAELAALYDSQLASVDAPTQRATLRAYLLTVLAYKRDPSLTRFAIEALDDPDADLRQAGLRALALMADPAAIGSVEPFLDGPSKEEWLLALGVLGNMDDARAVELLADQLRATDTVIARNAALLLARRADARAIPFVAAMLVRDGYRDDPGLRSRVVDAMDEASQEASLQGAVTSFLIEACRAAEILADRSFEAPLRTLHETDPSLKVRSAAINALQTLGASEGT